MPPLIINLNHAEHREKMAAFDYDWTLVQPKGGKTFPSNIDDWEWLYPTIPDKLRSYHEDGYMVVIFTNQSKAWKHDQIQLVAKTLEIPLFIVIATEKTDYKPNPILLPSLIGGNTILKAESFFVGDALGRKSDFSDSDKVFAENIGIPCFSPEQAFHIPTKEFALPTIPLSNEKEIIIMMGYPGSGKSTIAKHICTNGKYVCVEGDVYKTVSKMLKKSTEYISQKKCVVFDATNSSIKKRKEYIDHANKYGYKVLCVHVSTPLDVSYKRNKARDDDKSVPKIAYSVYSKYYEEPTETEGFTLYTI